jgi:large subunit ribosomal protein L20
MPRSKHAVPSHRRRRRLINKTKGRWGGKSRLLRSARETYEKGLTYAYDARRNRKGDFRRLWIVRINAAVRVLGMSYSEFMYGLKRQNVDINRKVLADLAARDPQALASLVQVAKK